MTCSQCESGTLTPGTSPMVSDRDGLLVVVRHVPAHVCAQCGHSVFDAVVVEAAQQQMRELRESKEDPQAISGTVSMIQEFRAPALSR